MNAKALLLIAASFALAGCPDKPAEKPAAPGPKVTAPPPTVATAPTQAPAPTAKEGCSTNCKVEVVVTESDGPGPKSCKITAPLKDDKINVKHGTWHVTWEIRSGTYEFDPNDGIVFPKAPAGVFTKVQGGGQKFVMKDKNDDAKVKGDHPYYISVQNPAGTVKCKLDPSVINDP